LFMGKADIFMLQPYTYVSLILTVGTGG
jgi:hypothetical protein